MCWRKLVYLSTTVSVLVILSSRYTIGQDTLSSQVLRLLDRVNTWTVAQTYAVDIQISTVNTAAPDSTACDAAGEVGKVYWDSTADVLWLCSGASGWRKLTTSAP